MSEELNSKKVKIFEYQRANGSLGKVTVVSFVSDMEEAKQYSIYTYDDVNDITGLTSYRVGITRYDNMTGEISSIEAIEDPDRIKELNDLKNSVARNEGFDFSFLEEAVYASNIQLKAPHKIEAESGWFERLVNKLEEKEMNKDTLSSEQPQFEEENISDNKLDNTDIGFEDILNGKIDIEVELPNEKDNNLDVFNTIESIESEKKFEDLDNFYKNKSTSEERVDYNNVISSQEKSELDLLMQQINEGDSQNVELINQTISSVDMSINGVSEDYSNLDSKSDQNLSEFFKKEIIDELNIENVTIKHDSDNLFYDSSSFKDDNNNTFTM